MGRLIRSLWTPPRDPSRGGTPAHVHLAELAVAAARGALASPNRTRPAGLVHTTPDHYMCIVYRDRSPLRAALLFKTASARVARSAPAPCSACTSAGTCSLSAGPAGQAARPARCTAAPRAGTAAASPTAAAHGAVTQPRRAPRRDARGDGAHANRASGAGVGALGRARDGASRGGDEADRSGTDHGDSLTSRGVPDGALRIARARRRERQFAHAKCRPRSNRFRGT